MRHRLGRLFAAALLPTLVVGVGPAAQAARSRYDNGLLGRQDPAATDLTEKYNVTAFTQSLALLGVAAGGRRDAPQTDAAIGWLLRQQCPDGGWQLYRRDVTAPCAPTDPAKFTGEDTNTTALAVQALVALGRPPRHDPLRWLRAAQNDDGGFGYVAGGPTDPDSTGLVTQALLAPGIEPRSWATRGGATPYDALRGFQLGCDAAAADRGGFSSLDPNVPDVLATAQAIPALAGRAFPLPATTIGPAEPTPSCPARRHHKPPADRLGGNPGRVAGFGATWAASQVNADGFVAGPSGPAYGLTAYTALGIAATGTNRAAAERAGGYLAAHVDAAAKDGAGRDQVGTLGLLAMTARATGHGSAVRLADRILANCTGGCRLAPSASPSPSPTTGGGSGEVDNGGQLPATGAPVAWLLLAVVILGGAGLLLRRAAGRR